MTEDQMFEVPGDRLRELSDEIEMLRIKVRNLDQAKDAAYSERDKLVAALSKMWPSHLMRHWPEDDPNWEPEWLNVVCVHLPTGRATWHIHISELTWFEHLNSSTLKPHEYDHHTTPEKYLRLFNLPVVWAISRPDNET